MTMTPPIPDITDQEHRAFLRRLRADLTDSVCTLDESEARYLVDLYYQIQEFRKASKNQVRSDEQEPNYLLTWMGAEFAALEATIKRAMATYTDRFEVTRWAKNIYGVGPVLAAGFYAQIDITKAPTAGSVWRFAGMDPTVTWKKKTKRPWNARLKVLAWKFADCQVKFSGSPSSFYGPLYREYKAKLVEANDRGDYAEAAAEGAERVSKKTQAYKHYASGKLSPGHIDARAKRWLAKLFLSHWHEVAYYAHHGEHPPKPYVIEHLGHAHKIAPPGWEPKPST